MAKLSHNVMLDEIREQSGLLAGLAQTRKAWTQPFVDLCLAHHFRRVLYVGNGSPYYGGCTLRYATERLLGVEAEAVMAAEFDHRGQFDPSGSFDPSQILLICPAETGHSRGQVDAARRARAQGIPVVCTTLNPTGVLARECNVVLPKPGGTEHSVAATKNQTMALYLVLTCLVEAAHALGTIDDDEWRHLSDALAAVPGNVGQTVDATCTWYDKNKDRMLAASGFFLIGYGANWGTVQEGTLKFVETHERPTMAVQLEETLHGPFRALHKHDIAFMLSAEAGEERDRMALLAKASRRYCDNIVTIQSQGQTRADDALVIASSDVPDVCAIEYLVPLQVIAALLSADLGIDTSVAKVPELDPVMLPAYED